MNFAAVVVASAFDEFLRIKFLFYEQFKIQHSFITFPHIEKAENTEMGSPMHTSYQMDIFTHLLEGLDSIHYAILCENY